VISRGDKARIALAPFHVIVGGGLCWKWWQGARTPMVLVLGLLFIAYGAYRLILVRRSLKGGR
jgi:hypothetical protein